MSFNFLVCEIVVSIYFRGIFRGSVIYKVRSILLVYKVYKKFYYVSVWMKVIDGS